MEKTMKKLTFILMFAIIVCAFFISCSSTPKKVDTTPSFVLTKDAMDAVDVFTVGSLTWPAEEKDPYDLIMIAKKPGENAHFKECPRDGFWPKADATMTPVTFHYCTPKNNGISDSDIYSEWKGTHLKTQVQCVNEDQGLCCVKFTSQYLQDEGKKIDDRAAYAGTWVVQFGTGLRTVGSGDSQEAVLDNVFYTAYVTIE